MSAVEWVEVVCTHDGRGVDAPPETVHRHYAGDDPQTVLANWGNLGRSARMVHGGRLAETVGEFRQNRAEPDTYAHRALHCAVCGETERVKADRLTNALWRVVDNGAEHADTRGVLRVPLSALRRIVSAID